MEQLGTQDVNLVNTPEAPAVDAASESRCVREPVQARHDQQTDNSVALVSARFYREVDWRLVPPDHFNPWPPEADDSEERELFWMQQWGLA